MNKPDLEQKILDCPGIILNKEQELLELCKKQTETNQGCVTIEAQYKSEIGMNKNLKNADERKASLEIMLRDHAGYQEMQKALRDIDLLVRKAQINLDFTRNAFRAYLAIAGMMGAQP